jgi:hypothetical protein
MRPTTTDLTLTRRGSVMDIAVADGDFSLVGGKSANTGLTRQIECLRTDVLTRLLTTPGEWLGDPTVGAGVSEMVGSPVTQRNLARVYGQITQALTRDLRIPVGDLDVRMQQVDATSFRIQVVVRVEGEIVDLTPDFVLDFSAGLQAVGIEAVEIA